MQKQTKPKPLRLSTAKLVLVGVLAVAVILAAGWWVWESQKIPERLSYERCLKLEAEISEDTSSIDNSCEIDSDCKPLNFGGNWMNICVNKNTNTLAVQSAVKNFLMKCPFPGVYPPVDECSCVENKCAAIIKKPQEVTIATDKTKYELGEIVKITVKNNLDKPIWYIKEICPPSCCNLYKLEDNEWKNLGDVIPCWSPPPPLPGESFLGGLKPDLLEPGTVITKQWDMTTRYGSAESGKYRFSFYYGLSKESYTEKTIYSNEFTIKEKSAVGPRCGQKVKFNPNCAIATVVYGYEFDSVARKCKEVNAGGGCDFETPFNTLEECQKVCEEKQRLCL